MSIIKKVSSIFKYSDRFFNKNKTSTKDSESQAKIIREKGFIVLEDLFTKGELLFLQQSYKYEIEKNFNFELPCLSQDLINETEHKELIDNYFRYNPKDLVKYGVTFDREDFKDYDEVINKYKPSTLKTYLTNLPGFFPFWLNENLLDIIESYMGLSPHLVEAYIRRNFPAKFKVMNHFWHRDQNHPDYLLKAFIFFTDCTVNTGPHEYISGTIKDQRLTGKNYYSDEEVDRLYPPGNKNRVQSIVKAGTVVLEDTRGLHRATIPIEGYRDLGFAIFHPHSIFSKKLEPYYKIKKENFKALSKRQQSYMPNNYIY